MQILAYLQVTYISICEACWATNVPVGEKSEPCGVSWPTSSYSAP